MRVAGALFDVVDVIGDRIVVVDMADPAETQVLAAGRAGYVVAVDDAIEPLMERDAAIRAANPNLHILDFVLMRICHGCRLRWLKDGRKGLMSR
jgi:hypothetical protein